MVDDRTSYLVVSPDETRLYGNGPSSHIPTFGAATTAVDQYRTVGVHECNLRDIGSAFTDVNAVVALAKVAEGGISHHNQLEAAETALQAILLHEQVHVLTYGPKLDYGNGLISYVRQDRDQRTELAYELAGMAHSRDFLVAPEFLKSANGKVVSSTFDHSPLIGMHIEQLQQGKQYWSDRAYEAIHVTVDMHGIPAYLTDARLMGVAGRETFSKYFYGRLRQPWDSAVKGIPLVITSIGLPPLLAIVLNRLQNRQDLKKIVMQLRDELKPARAELQDFNRMVTASTSQVDIESRVRRITESFDAIIPESRLTAVQRRRRKLLAIQRFTRPLLKMAAGFVTSAGFDPKAGLDTAEAIQKHVEGDGTLVDRTITAKAFTGMLRETEALQSLVKAHLSPSEISSIEYSLRRS